MNDGRYGCRATARFILLSLLSFFLYFFLYGWHVFVSNYSTHTKAVKVLPVCIYYVEMCARKK